MDSLVDRFKATLPSEYTEASKHRVRELLQPLLKWRYTGTSRFCPVCENNVDRFLPAGVRSQQTGQQRPNARCPICGSLERHRLLWMYLTERTDLFSPSVKKLLHIAPEFVLGRRLMAFPQIQYLSGDLSSPSAMVKMDITDIQYPDASFDVVLCNHVMEHVPDDRTALKEIFRVLTPGGWAILQTPIKGDRTDEDPTVTTPAQRRARFGQRDHVRLYGPDYRERLAAAGFTVTIDGFVRLMDAERAARTGLDRTEDIYRCSKPA